MSYVFVQSLATSAIVLITVAMLVIACIRSRRGVFLCASVCVILVALPTGIRTAGSVLTRLRQAYVAVPFGTIEVCNYLSAVGWLLASGITAYAVFKRRRCSNSNASDGLPENKPVL